MTTGAAYDIAVRILRDATARGLTVATAESLTGGLVAATLTGVPGASAVVLGGIVSYSSAVKSSVLGVPADLLAARGAVDPDVAVAMADGVASLLRADLAVATTGVAGPTEADGKPVGRVYIAVNRPGAVRELQLPGNREEIRAATVRSALELLADVMASDPDEEDVRRPGAGESSLP